MRNTHFRKNLWNRQKSNGEYEPVGASDSGIVVGPGRIANGVPSTTVVLTPGISTGATGNVVALGIMMNAVPPMIVVTPWRPAGAPATGIVVGPGITKP
jgi:hypothetical protein